MNYNGFNWLFFLLFAIAFGFAACGDESARPEQDVEHSDDEQNRLTIWTDDVELFALFEMDPSSGLITGDLFISRNSLPSDAASGSLSLRRSNRIITEQQLNASDKGVYPFVLDFHDEDEAVLFLTVLMDARELELELGQVYRYHDQSTPDRIPNLSSLDKEMQWRMSISSFIAQIHEIPEVMSGLGRVMADPNHSYDITSPVEGHIDSGNFSIVPVSGTTVNRGDRLIAISPSLSSENSWTELRLGFLQAEEAYNRARRLIENDAISLREYQLREREYEVRKAGYEYFLSGNNNRARLQDAGHLLYLNAHESGVISESYVFSGKQVKQGDPLFSIYNPYHLWLEVLVYRDELSKLPEVSEIELIAGRDSRITISQGGVRLVSRDLRSDASGSRSRLILSIDNPDLNLALDQPVRVRLKGNDFESFVAVPNEALFDEDSHKVVFVMYSGDQFERRIVQTGRSYGGLTAITYGLEAGERIVTQGIYPLHLLTGDFHIDDGHDH